MGVSNYLQPLIASHLFRGNVGATYYTRPTSISMGLFTVAPDGVNGAGTEVSGGSYVRTPVTFGISDSDGRTANNVILTFGPSTSSWGRIVAMGLFDQLGNLLVDAYLPTPITVPVGRGIRFQVGAAGVDFETYRVIAPDVNPPVLTITAPIAGEEIGGTYRVTGTATDDRGSVATIQVSAGLLVNLAATKILGTSDWFCDVDTDAASGGIDGALTITATGQDPSNNEGTAEVIVTSQNQVLDTSPPFNVTVSNLTNGETLTGPRTLTGTADDNNAVATMTVKVGTTGISAQATYDSSLRTWSYVLNPGAYPNGTYQIDMTATDTAGNVTTISRTGLVFNVVTTDVVAPNTTLTNPSVAAQEVSATFTITGTATDTAGAGTPGIDRVMVTFGSNPEVQAVLSGTQPNMNWSLSKTVTGLVDQTTYTISARAYDLSANVDATPATGSVKYVAPVPVIFGPRTGVARPAGAVDINVGDNVQAVIDANAVIGQKFWFKAGTHRMNWTPYILTPSANSQEFWGEFGAIISGAKNISQGFSGMTWIAEGSKWKGTGTAATVQPLTQNFYPDVLVTDLAYVEASYSDDVSVNGKPLKRMKDAASVSPGTFFFDYAADTIYIGDNPAGSTIELNAYGLATNGGALIQHGGRTGCKFKNLFIQQAISNGINVGTSWTLDGCMVAYNAVAGIILNDSLTLTNSWVHWNGQFGLRGGGTGTVSLTNSRINQNNSHCFRRLSGDTGWIAGGARLGPFSSLVMDGLLVDYNWGDGVWFSALLGPSAGVTIRNSTFEHNYRRGICVQDHVLGTSNNWLITNNLVQLNGGCGIWVNGVSGQSSTNKNVISSNRVFNNATDVAALYSGAISLVQVGNTAGVRYWNVASNEISMSSASGMDAGRFGTGVATTDVTFSGNTYHVSDTTRTSWVVANVLKSFAEWKAIHTGDSVNPDTNVKPAGVQGVTCRCAPYDPGGPIAPCGAPTIVTQARRGTWNYVASSELAAGQWTIPVIKGGGPTVAQVNEYKGRIAGSDVMKYQEAWTGTGAEVNDCLNLFGENPGFLHTVCTGGTQAQRTHGANSTLDVFNCFDTGVREWRTTDLALNQGRLGWATNMLGMINDTQGVCVNSIMTPRPCIPGAIANNTVDEDDKWFEMSKLFSAMLKTKLGTAKIQIPNGCGVISGRAALTNSNTLEPRVAGMLDIADGIHIEHWMDHDFDGNVQDLMYLKILGQKKKWAFCNHKGILVPAASDARFGLAAMLVSYEHHAFYALQDTTHAVCDPDNWLNLVGQPTQNLTFALGTASYTRQFTGGRVTVNVNPTSKTGSFVPA